MTTKTILALLVCALAFSGCVGQQPVVNQNMLVKDFIEWMAVEGDALVNTWKDGNGMTVFTRPLQTGWAVVMQTKWGERFGYFMNGAAWTTFLARIKDAGFAIVQRVPSSIQMPLIIMPVVIPSDGSIDSVFDLMPGMSGIDS